MSVRTNRFMLELLGGDPDFQEPNAEPVPPSLVSVAMEGFKEVDGCVVPRSFQATSIWSEARVKTDNIDDETGFECSINKAHLDDFTDAGLALTELARVGCAYAMYIRKALLDSPVAGKFRIIVAANPSDSELRVGNTCSVRFHRVRPNQVWLTDDLESYKQEALWVLDFEKVHISPGAAPVLN